MECPFFTYCSKMRAAFILYIDYHTEYLSGLCSLDRDTIYGGEAVGLYYCRVLEGTGDDFFR
jgi:hypothetical protein